MGRSCDFLLESGRQRLYFAHRSGYRLSVRVLVSSTLGNRGNSSGESLLINRVQTTVLQGGSRTVVQNLTVLRVRGRGFHLSERPVHASTVPDFLRRDDSWRAFFTGGTM